MKIALVSQEYPPETAKGGIGSQTWLKAHGLAALGHEVHVISRSLAGKNSTIRDGAVQVRRVAGGPADLAVHTEIADWVAYSCQVASAVAALHEERRLDLVEFPEWACEGFVHLLNRTQWNQVRTAIHLHGPLVMFAHTLNWPDVGSDYYRIGTMMEGTCLRLADAVFSSSACSANWCVKHYGLDAKTIPIWHSGVDVELFRPMPRHEPAVPTIIFAGKLARNKGVSLLVEAACQLAEEFPGLRLRLLGRGEPAFVQTLRAFVTQCGGRENLLEFPGFVPRDQLPEHLSNADVFAAPSQYEGGPGLVYLEAMACGLPVIACAGSGAAEVVRDGKTGLLVPPQDLPALTQGLRELLQDQARRRQMGAAARAYALAEADSRKCIRGLETLYSRIVAGEKPFRKAA